jgi:hypothetical protein
MDRTRVVSTDQFEVKSISGRIYEISEETTQTKSTFGGDSNTGWLDGAKHYKVRSGGTAYKFSQTGFHILASGENASRI